MLPSAAVAKCEPQNTARVQGKNDFQSASDLRIDKKKELDVLSRRELNPGPGRDKPVY